MITHRMGALKRGSLLRSESKGWRARARDRANFNGMLSTRLDGTTMRDTRATPEEAACRGTRPSASA